MKLLNKLKYRLLYRLMGECCTKSGGCRMCAARLDPSKGLGYTCAHGLIYEQAEKAWGTPNPIEKED